MVAGLLLPRTAVCAASTGGNLSKGDAVSVYVVNATDVVLVDPLGRRCPCKDTTCRAIPGAHMDSEILSRWLPGELPRVLIEAPAPSCSAYKVEARGLGAQTMIQFSIACGRASCTRIGLFELERGKTYRWAAILQRSDTSSSCRVDLVRDTVPDTVQVRRKSK